MKHRSIEECIYDLILSGEGVSPDGKLISERNLAEIFGTSRTTVRKAIDSLCKQGQLIPLHGKGTFVKNIKDFKYSQSLYSVVRCAQYYEERDMAPVISVLSKEVVPANEIVSSYLEVLKGDPVLRIEKLFQANRLILNQSISYLSLSSFPNANRENFSEPICEILRARYGAYPRKTENTIEAILPPTAIAKNLKITETTPIILFESLTTGIMDGRLLPLEYFKTYHRTDHLRFSFSQKHEAVY